MGLPQLRNKIFPMALVTKLTQVLNMKNMTSYTCQPSSQHMDCPPFYTGINQGFFSTFTGYTSPSFSSVWRELSSSITYQVQGTFPSKQSGADRAHISQ